MICRRWRKLSKEWHPDRYVNADKKLEAQEKFMEFSAAYETISKIKSRRARKNNSFQDYWFSVKYLFFFLKTSIIWIQSDLIPHLYHAFSLIIALENVLKYEKCNGSFNLRPAIREDLLILRNHLSIHVQVRLLAFCLVLLHIIRYIYINKQKQLFFPVCYWMGNLELMLRKCRFGCKSFFGNSFAPKWITSLKSLAGTETRKPIPDFVLNSSR